jgi:hypothetical protein
VSLPSVDKDTFYPTINGAGEQLVVVDFYTDWCAAASRSDPEQTQRETTLMRATNSPVHGAGAGRAS